MAAIPIDFPLEALVGQEVTQIGIAIAQVQIHLLKQPQPATPDKWSRGARIDVESALSVKLGRAAPIRVEPNEFRLAASLVAGLLEAVVTEVRPQGANELHLVFENGDSLCLHTDPSGFDSFHIHIGNESVTVTGA